MKKYYSLLLLLLLSQPLLAQIKFSYDAAGNRIKREATNTTTNTLEVSLTSLGQSAGGGTATFNITANIGWKVVGHKTNNGGNHLQNL